MLKRDQFGLDHKEDVVDRLILVRLRSVAVDQGRGDLDGLRSLPLLGAMIRPLAAVVMVLAIGGTAVAGQFEDGLAAYEKGQYATAFRLFDSLAYQGDIRAQVAVGRSYYDGKGVPQNFAAAVTWFEAAAARGSVEAQLYLGIMYDDGDGVARDRVAAAKWYRKVADQDPSIARVWLRFDADQGSSEAQLALGLLCAKGLGAPQDYVQAYIWLSLAASKNIETAAEERDHIVSLMTPDQLGEAQRRAREWVPVTETPPHALAPVVVPADENGDPGPMSPKRNREGAVIRGGLDFDLEGLPAPDVHTPPVSSPVQKPGVERPLFPTPVAAEGRRVALVVGNSAYQNVAHLTNPANDAKLIAAALRQDRFTVTLANNLNRDGLIKALRTFASEADSADWAVVYFAGHGIERGGTNFLIPVDAKLLTDRDVDFEAVPLGQVMSAIDGARVLRVVILDACRNNPFAATIKLTAGEGRDIGRGLARIEPGRGTVVVYSAKEGTIAADGDGADSPFATALAKHLTEAGVEVDKLFRLVRDDVLDATGNKQEPFVYGSLPGRQDFYFRLGAR